MLSAVIRSRRSYPAMLLAEQPDHQRSVHPGPLVLRADLLRSPAPAADRDRTVSRRSEPSSRTALNGEQPYPWDLLQPQDAMSRHRGAKPSRRYGLLGKMSLLSPGYLLSVERRANVPAGALISAGNSGRVARSFPAKALAFVNRSPVSSSCSCHQRHKNRSSARSYPIM